MSWYKAVFTAESEDLLLARRRVAIQRYRKESELGGEMNNRDAALFVPNKFPQTLTTLYFTPAAACAGLTLLHLSHAQKCDPPKPGTVRLVYGHTDALEKLERGTLI